MTTKLGWLVIESTARPGCDIDNGPQQFWAQTDAEAAAEALRELHTDDNCYRVEVRRETADDAEQHGFYL